MSKHDRLLDAVAYVGLLLTAIKVIWPEFVSVVLIITGDITAAVRYAVRGLEFKKPGQKGPFTPEKSAGYKSLKRKNR